ncbi:MAG: DUF1801 domain-containing protein [Hyphomicrobiales bacterium]|nr:DUF1801 domain-containing protein [Hyphomicrobiales bacterium]
MILCDNEQISEQIEPEVRAVIDSWSEEVRRAGLELRGLVYETASQLPEVGPLSEMLKWNQPAYLVKQTGAGTTIRMGQTKNGSRLGLYVHCQTTLVDTFRLHYCDQLEFEKKRAILLDPGLELPRGPLRHCISLALTYHLGSGPIN